MGMDVIGRNNKDAYFRANVWSWRPICALMKRAGFDVPYLWHSNDGAGLETQTECNALADTLETYLKAHPEEKEWEYETRWDMKVNKEGVFGKGKGFNRNPYSTDREHVEKFIVFLRICGGFKIF